MELRLISSATCERNIQGALDLTRIKLLSGFFLKKVRGLDFYDFVRATNSKLHNSNYHNSNYVTVGLTSPASLRLGVTRKTDMGTSFVSEESITLDRYHIKTYKSVRKITKIYIKM